ncbi:MAG: hypothetical protein JO187_01315 [Acidobacteria bacterium]|nr:hypothetical protein [Acidobacteriaceae bacterium]MBV9608171.1 hypothetical protein [Acidobacteriota bacterium]
MDPKIVVIVVVAIVVVLALAWFFLKRRRTAQLRERFGPEYERTVKQHGQKGEAVLVEREKRVEKFRMRDLAPDEQARFAEDWRVVQTRFVDDPKGAVTQADSLVISVMNARGYPMSDFEQRAADISVQHPNVVQNYRAAHDIAARHRRGEASTEDLRNAMIYYRSLFEELLGKPSTERREVA